ncbi:MAG: hypothetical protein ACNA7W_21155 [Pseudomonadales bacterium]
MAKFPLRALGFLLLAVVILVASCQALFYGVGMQALPHVLDATLGLRRDG